MHPPRPSPRLLRLLVLACVLAGLPAAAAGNDRRVPGWEREILAAVDSGFAEERRLYWMKCSGALASRRNSRRHALQGVGLFLLAAPIEAASARVNRTVRPMPEPLELATFALFTAAFWQLGLAYHEHADYARDRACCRAWQEFAATGN